MSTMVTKADGTKEVYNEDKIRDSATRVGVPEVLQDKMLEHIRGRLFDGIATKEIYLMIKEFLRDSDSPYLAMKYNLKDALARLGPSGYPFEKYVSLLLDNVGYMTKINQIIAGRCVSHEVDVLAQKDGITYFVEAKFHKQPSQRTDVRIALYIKARYDDLASNWKAGKTRAWIITNTRFSTDAIKYAECSNVRLTSWGYPKNEGIMDLIEHTGLHPVTMIDGLSQNDLLRLTTAGIVTCKQLLNPSSHHLLPHQVLETILPGVEDLCRSNPS